MSSKVQKEDILSIIQPFYTDSNGISSHDSKFYLKNGNVYTNLQNIQTGKIEEKNNRLSRILSINVVTDPENPDICNIKVSYMDNLNVEKFNEFNNMTTASGLELINEIKLRNVNITLKQDNKILQKRTRTSPTLNSSGVHIVTGQPTATAVAHRQQAKPLQRKNLAATRRMANAQNQGIYVAKGADLFLSEQERKEFYRLAPTVNSGKSNNSTRVAAEAEQNTASHTQENHQEEKKKPKKEPLRKRITKRLFGPKKEKKKTDLWKNGLKDITTAGLRLGSAALVILAVAGAFVPFLGAAMFIAGIVGLVATDTVIDFAENTAKQIKKGAEAGVQKSISKKQAKAIRKAEKKAAKEYGLGGRRMDPALEEQAREKDLQRRAHHPHRYQEQDEEIVFTMDDETTSSDAYDILNPNDSNYTHTEHGRTQIQSGRNGFDMLTGLPAKVEDKKAGTGLFESGMDAELDAEKARRNKKSQNNDLGLGL